MKSSRTLAAVLAALGIIALMMGALLKINSSPAQTLALFLLAGGVILLPLAGVIGVLASAQKVEEEDALSLPQLPEDPAREEGDMRQDDLFV